MKQVFFIVVFALLSLSVFSQSWSYDLDFDYPSNEMKISISGLETKDCLFMKNIPFPVEETSITNNGKCFKNSFCRLIYNDVAERWELKIQAQNLPQDAIEITEINEVKVVCSELNETSITYHLKK